MARTYYERLGVSPDASREEIERAYRERLKDVHPDVSDDPDAGARTRCLIEARDVLTDEAERDRYDRLGHRAYVERTDGLGGTASHDDGAHADDAATASRDGPSTAGAGTDGDGSGAGTTDSASDRTSAGAAPGAGPRESRTDRDRRRRQNRETRAGWNAAGEAGSTVGADEGARGWRAWDTDAPYRVHAADRTTIGNRLFPPGPSLVLLAVGFAIYPVLLWATFEPRFPLFVNLVLGACLVFLVVFLVGMPAVGVVVFGAWTVLLPLLLTVGLGVPPTSPLWWVGLGGTALPLGLAVLIHVSLRD